MLNFKRLREQREERWDMGGEGSRGGHVIGRTKSGKPIYDHHGHPEHAGFSKEEHLRAADLHHQKKLAALSDKTRGQGKKAERDAKYKHHDQQYVSHVRSAMAMGHKPGEAHPR